MCNQNCGDACRECHPGMREPDQARYQSHWQIRVTMRIRDGERKKVAKDMSCVPRKAAIVSYIPVPKPTQVDEEKIHRPTGEVLLRNSAK